MSLRDGIVQAVVVPLVDTRRRKASSRRALSSEARNAVSEGEPIAMANRSPYNLYIPCDVSSSLTKHPYYRRGLLHQPIHICVTLLIVIASQAALQ